MPSHYNTKKTNGKKSMTNNKKPMKSVKNPGTINNKAAMAIEAPDMTS